MLLFAYGLAKELKYANVDAMLEEMDADQIVQWTAFFKIQDKEHKRAALAAKAEAGVENQRRGRRR